MLRFAIALMLVGMAAWNAMAEPTYILIDHSGSMSNGEKQDRVDTVIDYYAENPSVTELSLTYFGSENGGNCTQDVDISPLRKNGQQITPSFSADLNTPILSALDGVVEHAGSSKATIVVVTDGDDACNSSQAICMAVAGYRRHYPNLKIKFEGVKPENAGEEFLSCVSGKRPSRSSGFPGVTIAMQTLEAERLPKFHFGILHFYFLASIPFMMFAQFVWGKVRRTTSLISKLEQSQSESAQGGMRKDGGTPGDTKPGRNWTIILSYSAVIITAGVWTLLSMEHVLDWWQDSFAYLNTRLGAAVATVAFGSLLGFLMLAIWKNSLQQLENQFIEASNLEANREREAYFSRFRTSYHELVSSLQSPTEDEQEEFNTWKSQLDLFFQDLSAKIQSKVNDASWNPARFSDLSFDLKPRKFRSRLASLRLESQYDYFIDELSKYS